MRSTFTAQPENRWPNGRKKKKIYSLYISRIQSYLLVKIALRFLSRIPKIYVDPRGIAQGVPP